MENMAEIVANNKMAFIESNFGAITNKFDFLQKQIEELYKDKHRFDFVELKCKNCGGGIQQKYEDVIIKCPYCGSVYAVGTRRVNETI